MARIRTIKPAIARHEKLFEMEQETGWPVRFVWAMLPTVCDREGRFKWQPRPLKLDILPYDDIDFARVLDAFATRGFLVKYRVGDEWFGCIPTFKKHQSINNKEYKSELPSPEEADETKVSEKQEDADASSTREPRVDDATVTPLTPDQGEYGIWNMEYGKDTPVGGSSEPSGDESLEAKTYRRGKEVLGKKSGGLVTKLKQMYEGDIKAALDIIEQAADKHDPNEWIGAVLANRERPRTPEHITYPPDIYRNVL